MRLIIYMLLLLFNIASASAQTGSLKGTVLDNDGELLAYATIIIFDGELAISTTKTDTNGIFNIASIDPGTYWIRVIYIVSEAAMLNIQVSRGDMSEIIIRMITEGEGMYPEINVFEAVYAFNKAPIPSGSVMFMDRNTSYAPYSGPIIDRDSFIQKENRRFYRKMRERARQKNQ